MASHTTDMSFSWAHGFVSLARFPLCVHRPSPHNSVAPNSFTSYLVPRTSIPPRPPASKLSPTTKLVLFLRRLRLLGTPVPIKFSKNAAMLIPMRVADVLRTKGASTSRVHEFVPHARFPLCVHRPSPRNLVAPNSFTSYFVLRTSYLITPVSSCLKDTAHHKPLIYLGQMCLFGTEVDFEVDMGCLFCYNEPRQREMMQTYDNQLVTPPPPPRKQGAQCEYFVRLAARVARVVVAVLLLSAGVQAGYKPVDISNIKGEQREKLTQIAKAIASFPKSVRDAFLCEQLGLCFKKDGSMAMWCRKNSTRFHTYPESWYVTGGGKIAPWWGWWKRMKHMTKDAWYHAFEQWMLFPCDYLLSFYPKDVEKLALNTARHLLRTMPKEERWMLLASMGNMLYNDNGPYNRGRESWKLDDAVSVKSLSAEGRGYCFLDPEGKERDIRAIVGEVGAGCWRWRWTVWRCENLVGSKDILELFPEEVEAMRKHFKGRVAKVKDEAKAKTDALMVAADEMMSSLPKEKRLARIALAVGLYYLDHREAGCTDGHLNPNTTFILPDGTKHRGEEFVGEAPGLLQQIPHEAILGYYRQPIEQMAREVAKERFKEMPPVLRDLLRARLSRKLINLDGSPAEFEEGVSTVQTFDRTWEVPMDAVDHQKTYFKDSQGQNIPCSIVEAYHADYGQTFRLVNLCARILGKEETVKLIPPGGGTALTAEQRYAWLAEKMGFCFTEDGAPAYQSERTANENAVYVDAQGKVHKLAEASGRDSAGWTEATSTALAVGYDKFAAPYKEKIKQLAVQTSKYILGSMPPGLRQSWLAERNKFFFRPNPGDPYRGGDCTLDSGIKVFFQGSDYVHCLYYDPSGKVVKVADIGAVWKNRWWLLYYCETVAGIEAINKSFSAEVEPMRAAFQKSPFHKK